MGALKPKGLNSCYTMWNDAVYAILYEMMRFMLYYVKWCGLCYAMWNDAVYAMLCEMMRFMLYYEQKIRIALKILELKKNI